MAVSIGAIVFGLLWAIWVRYVYTPRLVPRMGRPIGPVHTFWVTRCVPIGFIAGGLIGVFVTGLIGLA